MVAWWVKEIQLKSTYLSIPSSMVGWQVILIPIHFLSPYNFNSMESGLPWFSLTTELLGFVYLQFIFLSYQIDKDVQRGIRQLVIL